MAKNKKPSSTPAEQLRDDLGDDPKLAAEFNRYAQMKSEGTPAEQLRDDQAGEQLGEGDQLDPQSAELLNPDAQLAELEAVESEEAAENDQLRELLTHVADVIGSVLTSGGHLLRATQARQLVDLERRVKSALNPSWKGT